MKRRQTARETRLRRASKAAVRHIRPGQRRCGRAARNGLRSRVRRFESCWGRFLDQAKWPLTCQFFVAAGLAVCSQMPPMRRVSAVPGTYAERAGSQNARSAPAKSVLHLHRADSGYASPARPAGWRLPDRGCSCAAKTLADRALATCSWVPTRAGQPARASRPAVAARQGIGRSDTAAGCPCTSRRVRVRCGSEYPGQRARARPLVMRQRRKRARGLSMPRCPDSS